MTIKDTTEPTDYIVYSWVVIIKILLTDVKLFEAKCIIYDDS